MTIDDLKNRASELKDNIVRLDDCLDWDKKRKKIAELEIETQRKDIWDDRVKAGKIFKQLEALKAAVKRWEELKKNVDDLEIFLRSASSQEDEALAREQYNDILDIFMEFERRTLYQGKYDENDAVLSIHAGAGGTDAQDWAEMLLRMILRYAEKKGYKARILHDIHGVEAGIKSATVEISGSMAYGNLKAEAGVHRLVRLSPFNSDNLRQTSFALIEAIPLIEGSKDITIDQKDIKVDTYRSSGAGGQSVNTTDSAVRITHLPTGMIVTCQNERSQLQNKDKALEILRSKLALKKKQETEQAKKDLKGEHKSVEWGSQIRSYVLHPYKLVKDHRTGVESKNPDDVLGGNLDKFIEEWLRQQVAGEKTTANKKTEDNSLNK
ncbi:MAG: peptide chain release factor 2 [Patescibacteria group bacterium]|nr:peptide chain release factor 2 [Patescibacteria group bacterium]